MPGVIDPETMYVDALPAVWAPVQSRLTEAERLQELEQQSIASLLWSSDAPEAVLRLLLAETAIERTFSPPAGYDPEQQGAWDDRLAVFAFRRPIHLEHESRMPDQLILTYSLDGAGTWEIEVRPERVVIRRL
jgi:hypothetical protein